VPGRSRMPRPQGVRESEATPRWLTRAHLEMIHQATLQEHGGRPGIRDEGMLDSALNRPRNKFTYGESDLAALAAACAFGLARNHGFIDGDKRVAFQAMYVFLGLNRQELDAAEPEVVDVMRRLAAGRVTEASLATWVREHMRALGPAGEH
jgi:death on curing protein